MENIKFENYGKNIDDLDFVEKNFFEDLDLIISESSLDFEVNDISDEDLNAIFEFSQEDECLLSVNDKELPTLYAVATELNELVLSSALSCFTNTRERASRKLSVTRKWDHTCAWTGDIKQGVVKHSAGDKFAATYLFFSQSDLKDIFANVKQNHLKFMKTLAKYTFDNLDCLNDLIGHAEQTLITGKRMFNYKVDTASRNMHYVHTQLLNLLSQVLYRASKINTAKCSYIYARMINLINHTINMLRAMLMYTMGKCGEFDIVVVINGAALNSVSFKSLDGSYYTSDVIESCFKGHFDSSVKDSISQYLSLLANIRLDMYKEVYSTFDDEGDDAIDEEV